MWEILSYQGTIDEVVLTSLFERLAASRNEAQGSDPGRCDPEKKRAAQIAKYRRRYARHVQRLINEGKLQLAQCGRDVRELLREFWNDGLRVTANRRVIEQGRGRLHGDVPGEYLDIGTNQEFSFVCRVLDGPKNRPCTDRFKH